MSEILRVAGTLAILAVLACRPGDDPTEAPIEPYDPLPWVDPFIGTGGQGFGVGSVNPGPRWPFGMVHVGPDTRHSSYGAIDFLHCAGYHFDDDLVMGFSHTHAHGMGVADYGAILLMPRDGWQPGHTRGRDRAAPFRHATEQASPGYYAVTLDDDGVRVELTATARAARHRYTFPEGADPVVVLDLGHFLGLSGEVAEAWADVDGATLQGFQRMLGSYSRRFGGLQTWFAADFDPAPVGVGGWEDPDHPEAGLGAVDGPRSGLWLQFPAGTTVVEARVGISYVDQAGAWGNLQAEIPAAKSFEAVRSDAEGAWREELSATRVRGGTDRERRIFHTALYNAYKMPSLNADVDGRYRGFDDQVHTVDFDYYTDFSLWDTYRTLHPWMALARPERQRDMVRSLLRMARDGGSLPQWPLGHGYTGGMLGSPVDPVLAETWLKGIEGWDADLAFDLAWAHATGPVEPMGRSAIEGYRSRGWVATGEASYPASRTLEYAWADHALALWAERSGRPAEAEVLWAQSRNWANHWDPAQGFLVGRYADGAFETLGSPTAWNDAFIEGNAWQYLWMMPQDVQGIIEVQHGGDREAFLERFDHFFALSYPQEKTALPDPYYWHGNEPDIHYPWLAALAGDADRSVEPVRWVMQRAYDDAPDGLAGNDDGGTLSAWYLLSASGIFPVAGTDRYALGPPVFERVEIDRPEGTLVIRAPGLAEGGRYLGRVTAGEGPWEASVLDHDTLVSGELVLELKPEPQGFGR